MNNTRIIIPAVSFARNKKTRLSMELEVIPVMDSVPKQIDFSLSLGRNSVVVTREAKQDFVAYIKGQLKPGRKLKLCGNNMNNTYAAILEAEDYWDDKNVVVVDVLNPIIRSNSLSGVISELGAHEVVVLTKPVDNPFSCLTIGIDGILYDGTESLVDGKIYLQVIYIGFVPRVGEKLFRALRDKQEFSLQGLKTKIVSSN